MIRHDDSTVGVALSETQSQDAAARGLASSAYLEAALDCVIVADASGRVVEFNPAAERTFGYRRADAVGRTLAELIVPPALREQHTRAFARCVASGEGRLFGRRLELTGMRADGSEFPVELTLSRVDGEPLLVCGSLRDLSEAKRAEEELRRNAAEREALRRVATLVAGGVPPPQVFAAVAEGVAELLAVPAISMVRFDADGTATKVAGWGESPFPVGSRWALDDPSVMRSVARTGRPARIDDYSTVPGAHARRIRETELRAAVGVPIAVAAGTWGAVIAFSTDARPLPSDAEDRLARFTELVATAIANTQARDELHRLAEEQAALRRIALLVATEAAQPEVLAAVAREVGRVLDGAMIEIVRCEPNRRATGVGAWGDHPFVVGSQWTLDGPSVIASVVDTGRPARIDDYGDLPGSVAAFAREAGFRSAVGAPIMVEGKTWGVICVLSRQPTPLPPDTEARLAAFGELVGTAISRTEAREALRRSEELYRRAIAEAGAVPYVLDHETGTYSFIGDGIEELTGYRPAELTHEAFGSLVLETFLYGDQARLDATEAAHRTRAGEFERWRSDLRIRARDGTIRWLSDASVEVLGDLGRSVGSIGMLQDITERMRTDEERLRLAAILEATTDVVTLTDPEGRIVYMNQAGRRLLGLTANEQLSGVTSSDFRPAAAVAQVLEDAIPIAVREGVWSGESALLTRDGREIPVSQVILAHKDALGEVTFFSGIARDLTERLRLEERVRRTQDEQAALRRVATLVAEGATPNEVFAAVAEEVARLLEVPAISMVRFERDETSTAIAVWGDQNPFGVGATFEPWPGVMLQVRRTGRPARLEDFASSTGPTTARLQAARIHSGVGVPITVEGRVWGTLIALATGGESLPGGVTDRLSNFTDLVATAIANAEARDALDAFLREQEALRRVATITAVGAGPQDVFDAVVAEVKDLLDLPVVALTRYEPDGMVLMMAAAGPHPFRKGTRWPLEGLPVASMVLERGEPAYLEEYVTDDPTTGPAIDTARVRSGLAVPIMVDNEVWGTISTASTDVPLPPETEKRLVGFTELVAAAVLNAQARDELGDVAKEQAALRRVATLVARETSPGEVFDAVAREVAEILDAQLAIIARYEADGTAAVLGGHGAHPFHPGTVWELDGPSAAGEVRRTGRPARWSDSGSGRGDTLDAARRMGLRSSLGVPITVGGNVWGVIVIATDVDAPIGEAAEARLVDFTELVGIAVANTQTRDDLRLLADEQAALRRVATLVAEGAGSPAVYDAICQETGLVIGATSVNLCHFTADRFNLTMAGWSIHDTHVPTGTRLPIEGGTINELVYERGAPARIESYADAQGALADLIRARGIRSEVAAPVIVDGRLWGSIIAGWDTDEAPPAGAERRLAGFAELVATAVSNALTRSELVASRARIVTAADEARRRIERNLHDGIQQQLVSLQLELKTLDAGVPPERRQTHEDIDRAQGILGTVLDDVREIAQGVHPATLSQWGLGPAIRTLARRSPIPVELDLQVPERLPQSVEIAVYYAVSEALANVAKHARGTHAAVTVNLADGWLHASVRDDGIGGADTARGSGIAGLVDRVEALGGRLALSSAPGQGTTVSVALPLGGGSAGEL